MKVLIAILATPIVLLGLSLAVYVLVNRQGVIQPYQVGNPNAETRILIASQGSEFKNTLVEELISQLKSPETYLSVVDCTTLNNENADEWDAIIIIHTLQIHKMPEQAEVFLKEMNDYPKVMLVSTSGAGDDTVEGFKVDAISSASRKANSPAIIKWLMAGLEKKIGTFHTSSGSINEKKLKQNSNDE